MAQGFNLRLPSPPVPLETSLSRCGGHQSPKWVTLLRDFQCKGRHTCLFSDNRRQEQARKALEGALGGKKTEFEKWNKEIQKREQSGGGSNSGGGGRFGGGGWFGWSNNERFWEEAQQVSITILCILALYLLLAKGQVMLAIFFNSVLFVLRGVRNGILSLPPPLSGKIYPSGSPSDIPSSQESPISLSAKDNVVRKWGADS